MKKVQALPILKKHWLRLCEAFTVNDILFLLLRLGTIAGGFLWLTVAPVTDTGRLHHIQALTIFSLYSCGLYLMILTWIDQIRHIYVLSFILDASFVYWMVHLQASLESSFFLGYYMLVALHTLYFGYLFGILVTTLVALLYSHNLLIYWGDTHWSEFAFRVTFLYLLGLPLGIISEKLRRDKQKIESLNNQLSTSLDNLQKMQTKLVESEKLSALGRLTNDVAHEIRNPLSALGGLSRRLIKMLPAGSKEKKYSETIVSEVTRLEAILRDTLLLSSVSKEMIRSDLNDTTRKAVAFSSNLYQGESLIRIVEHYQPDLPSVYLDQDEVRQAVGNLVSNAIDIMPHGGTLTITTGMESTNEITWLTVAIADTGHGVPPEEVDRIFEPFYSIKQAGTITGLGLAIVHKIMEDHRGFVRMHNSGQGALFTLYFPYQSEKEDLEIPCWECLGCGVENDPSHRCPAYPNFGRICWAIAGTMCEGRVLGTYAEKIHNCTSCPFFRRLKQITGDQGQLPSYPALDTTEQA